MTSSFQAALARAQQRAASDHIVITREVYGETFEFRFKPRPTDTGVEIIGRLGRQHDLTKLTASTVDAAALDDLMKAVTELLSAQAADETDAEIAELMRAGVIGIRELLDIQRELMEKIAGRPTMSSSPSPKDSSTPGPTSTDGVPPAPSTPLPSPSTDS